MPKLMIKLISRSILLGLLLALAGQAAAMTLYCEDKLVAPKGYKLVITAGQVLIIPIDNTTKEKLDEKVKADSNTGSK